MRAIAAEKLFENKIKKYLKDNGHWYLKYWAGAEFTKSGIPDILACVNGYFVAIEVKAPTGKPSELQKYNICKIIADGGFGVVVRPDQWNELKRMLESLEEERLGDAECSLAKINSLWEI